MADSTMLTSLFELPILVVDCQTTGASPAHGHLIELAWSWTAAALHSPDVVARKIALPQGATVSRRVQQITGLGPLDLVDAPAALEVCQELRAQTCARQVAAVVAHYARFERSFVEPLDTGLSHPWICTHAIARRLLPGLPRLGLRAVAGYLGYTLAEEKRAGDHVLATAFVWRAFVDLFEREHAVFTLADLMDWLVQTPAPRDASRIYAMPREKRLALPETPGVYHLLSRSGDVLYVGKASSLKDRVNSYFRSPGTLSSSKHELVSQVHDIAVTETGSSLEAALLENEHIKHLAPPYNASLREGRRRVVYLSSNLTESSPVSAPTVMLGPLIRRDERHPIELFAALVETTTPDALWAGELAGGHDVDAAALAAGFALFRERHGLGTQAVVLADLLRLGRELLRARERAIAIDDPDELPVDEQPADSPQAIATRLERILSNFSRELARARWLCRLSESVLAWEDGESPEHPRRMLVIHQGRVWEQGELEAGEPLPLPPGHRRSRLQRQGVMDLGTYDRLRVLTTELRRLVAADKALWLRVGHAEPIKTARLARILLHL
ncbi:MAG: GIY-YIG nuclease family protein [Bradymonadaceae bacterium]|nr:GIY-YIG nuclease family protein [Lujinxingiaceae bacterium]